MIAVGYVLGLWLLGFVVALGCFPRTLSPVFFAWSAYLFGAMVWMFGGLLMTVSPLTYSPLTMGVWVALVTGVAVGAWWVRGVRLSWTESRAVALVFAAFALVAVGAQVLRFAFGTYDAVAQLRFAEYLAHNIYTENTRILLTRWGIFLPTLHAPSRWVGQPFFLTVQPLFMVSLLGLFVYLTRMALQRDYPGAAASGWPVVMVVIVASAQFMVMLTVAFYSNTLSAAYFSSGVLLLWNAHRAGEPRWVPVAVALLAGFTFTRTETVIFLVPVVVVFLAQGVLPPRVWYRALAPLALVTLGWYGWLATGNRLDFPPEVFVYLTPLRALAIGLMVPVIYPLIFVTQLPLVRRRLPATDALVLGGALVLLSGAIVLEPQLMLNSIYNTLQNLFMKGVFWWGASWLFMVLALVILWDAPPVTGGRLLVATILAFFTVMLLLSFLAGGSYHSWSFRDSGSRMSAHVLPILAFYVTLRAAPLFERSTVPDRT